MPLEVRQISCPNCAASLDIRGRRAKSIVCSSCGSHLDLTDPALGILASFANRSAPTRTPIELGMWGDFKSRRWQVIGRIRYREGQWFWDEWLLITEEGEYLWLTEGEEGFTLYDPVVPAEPIDPAVAREILPFDGTPYPIRTRGTGTIDFLEGEMNWKATLGSPVRYIDAQLGQNKFAIEWTENEIEYFLGEKQAPKTITDAFNLPEPAHDPHPVEARPKSSNVALAVFVLILLCVICVGLMVVLPSDDGDGGSGLPGIIFVPGGGTSSGGSRGPSRTSSGGTRGSSGGSRSSGGGK